MIYFISHKWYLPYVARYSIKTLYITSVLVIMILVASWYGIMQLTVNRLVHHYQEQQQQLEQQRQTVSKMAHALTTLKQTVAEQQQENNDTYKKIPYTDKRINTLLTLIQQQQLTLKQYTKDQAITRHKRREKHISCSFLSTFDVLMTLLGQIQKKQLALDCKQCTIHKEGQLLNSSFNVSMRVLHEEE